MWTWNESIAQIQQHNNVPSTVKPSGDKQRAAGQRSDSENVFQKIKMAKIIRMWNMLECVRGASTVVRAPAARGHNVPPRALLLLLALLHCARYTSFYCITTFILSWKRKNVRRANTKCSHFKVSLRRKHCQPLQRWMNSQIIEIKVQWHRSIYWW